MLFDFNENSIPFDICNHVINLATKEDYIEITMFLTPIVSWLFILSHFLNGWTRMDSKYSKSLSPSIFIFMTLIKVCTNSIKGIQSPNEYPQFLQQFNPISQNLIRFSFHFSWILLLLILLLDYDMMIWT